MRFFPGNRNLFQPRTFRSHYTPSSLNGIHIRKRFLYFFIIFFCSNHFQEEPIRERGRRPKTRSHFFKSKAGNDFNSHFSLFFVLFYFHFFNFIFLLNEKGNRRFGGRCFFFCFLFFFSIDPALELNIQRRRSWVNDGPTLIRKSKKKVFSFLIPLSSTLIRHDCYS